MCSIVHTLGYSFNVSTSTIGHAGCWDRKAHVRCITSLGSRSGSGSGGTLYTPLSSAPRNSIAMRRSTVGHFTGLPSAPCHELRPFYTDGPTVASADRALKREHMKIYPAVTAVTILYSLLLLTLLLLMLLPSVFGRYLLGYVRLNAD